MAEPLRQQLERVSIPNFWGMDARRNPDSNESYGVGAYCANLGRDLRAPLHPRRTLRPLTSDDGGHVQYRAVSVMIVMGVGGRMAAAMLDDDGNIRFARGLR